MKHEIAHELDQETARRAAHAAGEFYAQRFARYRPEVRWVDEDRCHVAFHAKGLELQGELALAPGCLLLDLDLPLPLWPFKKLGLALIEREFYSWLRKANEGTL